jgi:exo-beta-1,3-glucanase (GH17 family)
MYRHCLRNRELQHGGELVCVQRLDLAEWSFLPSGVGTSTVSATSAQDSSKSGTASVSTSTLSVPYRLYGIDYSPYVGSQSPGSAITDAQIKQQLQLIAPYAQRIRTYQCTGLEHVPSIAAGLGIGVDLGVWIGPNDAVN